MFKPVYRITPFLLSCFEHISAQRVYVEQMEKYSPLRMNVNKDSVNRSAHSSTWIEGNRLSLAQVALLSADKDIVAQDKEKLEVKNCIKALRSILQHKNSPLTETKLLKLHETMTKKLLPPVRCGKYRKVQNYIVNVKGQVIFTPVSPLKVKQRMRDIFMWLKQNTSEHPIIRSAVFHHAFVAIHPFTDGNGRVARAASQWILLNGGYDSVWTLGLDEFFAQDRAKYYDMIQQTHDMDGDYTYWIEYVAKGLLESVKTVSKRFKKQTLIQKQVALTPKQVELMELLEKHGILGSAEICKWMNINRARVNQLISPLIKAGIVSKEGATRGVKYRLK